MSRSTFTAAHPPSKISHRLPSRFDEANNDKKTKYTQLYNTFKKSLGISADLDTNLEFDSAFS